MPPHRNEVDWVPISGGGEPSSVPTAKKAPAHEAPASRAAAKAAITVSQKRRAIGGSRVVALCLRISAAHPAAQRGSAAHHAVGWQRRTGEVADSQCQRGVAQSGSA